MRIASRIECLELAGRSQFAFKRRKGQYERQRFVVQRNGTIAGIPGSGSFVFGVYDQQNPADLGRNPNASAPGRPQKLTPKPFPLHANIRCKPREPETGHFMPGESAPNQFGRVGVIQAARSNAIETENRLVVGVTDGEERLGPA